MLRLARHFSCALLLMLPLAHAAEVSMAFGEKIPPFCFPESNSGIEVEVIREALAYRGHTLKPRYYAFARVPVAFKNGEVDATTTDLGDDLTAFGGFYGEPAIFYDNVLITLQSRNLSLHKPEDLDGKTVASFQGALKRYPEWLGPVKKAGRYFELANQRLQVLTLDAGRYDVVLSDRSIFRYYSLKVQKEKGITLKPVQEHAFTTLNPLDYRPVFRDRTIRDDFNAGLEQLKKTGRYQAIYDKYLKGL